MKNKHLLILPLILFFTVCMTSAVVAQGSPFGMFKDEEKNMNEEASDDAYSEFVREYKLYKEQQAAEDAGVTEDMAKEPSLEDMATKSEEMKDESAALMEESKSMDMDKEMKEESMDMAHGDKHMHHDKKHMDHDGMMAEADSMDKDMMMGEDYEDIDYRSGGVYTLKEDVSMQTVEQIRAEISIDDAFIEAKSITLPESKPVAKEEEEPQIILTSQDIIRSIITEENKTSTIDLDFDEVTLSDIFHTLGKAAKINVLLDPTIKNQQLDLHLKQVSLEEAFMLIANAYDLGFKRIGNSLYVTLKAKIAEESLVSKVIKLKNIPAQEAQIMVEELVQSVNVSEEINSLIVMGQPDEIVEVEKVIDRIDVPQPQVVIEAKIIEVDRNALKDLGVDWSDEIRISYQEGGRPQEFSDDESPNDRIFQINRFARGAIQFETVINMLEEQSKAKVLSNPSITTLNDKEAEIFVGDRVPYTVTNVTGGVATTDVRWVEPGIRLIITPSIIEDDFVVLKVEPEVSFIFAFRGPNDEFPQVKTREATAYVRVANGEPFVLGGLLNQEDKKSVFKVPVLGDVPLLGNLFSYEDQSLIDTELIITVKPIVVHGEIQ